MKIALSQCHMDRQSGRDGSEREPYLQITRARSVVRRVKSGLIEIAYGLSVNPFRRNAVNVSKASTFTKLPLLFVFGSGCHEVFVILPVPYASQASFRLHRRPLLFK